MGGSGMDQHPHRPARAAPAHGSAACTITEAVVALGGRRADRRGAPWGSDRLATQAASRAARAVAWGTSPCGTAAVGSGSAHTQPPRVCRSIVGIVAPLRYRA